MKTAMKIAAVTMALAIFMSASPPVAMARTAFNSAAPSAAAPTGSTAMAKTGKDAKVFEILKNETQFSMFYKALVDTTEIWNVEGRTVLVGEQLILFAPTNAAFSTALSEEVMTCLQKEPGQATLVSFLKYLQVVVPNNATVPQVKTPKQLLNLTKDGFLWTVGGKGIAVTEDADGSIRLTSDDGVDSVTVQEARPTDPTVTLIPLEEAVIVDEDVGNTILSMCFGEEPSQSSTAAPSSGSLPAPELSSEDSHAASSKESATQVASFRSLWELLF